MNAPLPANWWTAPRFAVQAHALSFTDRLDICTSVPNDVFHSHHEAKDGHTDVSLAFVGLHSALSLFNSSACLLLLPGWSALDMGGDAIGKQLFYVQFSPSESSHRIRQAGCPAHALDPWRRLCSTRHDQPPRQRGRANIRTRRRGCHFAGNARYSATVRTTL